MSKNEHIMRLYYGIDMFLPYKKRIPRWQAVLLDAKDLSVCLCCDAESVWKVRKNQHQKKH